jgi:hypothetical protein
MTHYGKAWRSAQERVENEFIPVKPIPYIIKAPALTQGMQELMQTFCKPNGFKWFLKEGEYAKADRVLGELDQHPRLFTRSGCIFLPVNATIIETPNALNLDCSFAYQPMLPADEADQDWNADSSFAQYMFSKLTAQIQPMYQGVFASIHTMKIHEILEKMSEEEAETYKPCEFKNIFDKYRGPDDKDEAALFIKEEIKKMAEPRILHVDDYYGKFFERRLVPSGMGN